MKKLLLLLPLLLALVGCDQFGQSKKISLLEKKIEGLTFQINELFKLQQQMLMADLAGDFLMARNIHESAIFTPSAKGYQSINTSAGNLLVALVDIKKYANGYKATFDIGNPTLATITDVTALISYGKGREKGEDYDKWQENLKKTSAPINKELFPGIWSRVNVVIAPAKEEDLGHIIFSIQASQLSLRDDYRAIEE